MTMRPIHVVLTMALLVGGPAGAAAQELGTITFPTSGAAAAQPAFLEGVKALHSFQFDEAAVAFKRAQQADPNFALAYWGEAMSYNHPLWAQQDTEAAKKTLERLAPTHEARLAKAKLEKEKAFLEAMQQLYYSPGDKLTRDNAYSEAMARMHEKWPDDHEIATFYALSLLGTVRPGDTGYRRQALAASLMMNVFDENPKHPGAAHFIIHSFDDPEHAPLALPAANEYAQIAPAAGHALHMPSHIYVQLGMWDRVASSNVAAYKAAIDLQARMKLSAGRDDFHALSWLLYANLMLGKTDEAAKNVATAKQTLDRNPNSRGVQNGYQNMRARYILETGQWDKLADGQTAMAEGSGDAHAGMPGMQHGGDANTTWTFIEGFSAAKRGDIAAADAAAARLRAERQKLEGGANAYRAKEVGIMEKEVAAAARQAEGKTDAAMALAKEAVDIELTTSAPSGPPEPMKPALELYGELLLEANRPAEAAKAFEQSLLRTPRRTPSLLGLARASMKTGDTTTAREAYNDIATMPGAASDSPAMREARKAVKSSATDPMR